jgi:glucose-1-phosphate adenylyltransferase
MKKGIIAMLLAGGVGSRLSILVSKRAKPALVFGAIYRIIDFTLSSIANSHIDIVGVLTQYKPLSLMEHLDGGRPWDLFGRTRLAEVLPPKTGEEISDWYKGTADAVYQNIGFVEDYSPELVLIVSGDHIYAMDYNKVIAFHRDRRADATVCLVRVPQETVHQFGIAETNSEGAIINWIEKPKTAKSNLASMGIYVFNRTELTKYLTEAAKQGGHDFAKDIIPRMIRRKRVFGYTFNGYWRDVGTVQSYWEANMDMLNPESGLHIKDWGIKTNLSAKGAVGDRPSSYVARTANISNSLIARGCIIRGAVENSILSPGVQVMENARVKDSVLFNDTLVGANSVLENIIVDKQVHIGESVTIGHGPAVPNRDYPAHLYTGITIIGKGAVIAGGISIGKNCIVRADSILKGARTKLDSGSTV